MPAFLSMDSASTSTSAKMIPRNTSMKHTEEPSTPPTPPSVSSTSNSFTSTLGSSSSDTLSPPMASLSSRRGRERSGSGGVADIPTAGNGLPRPLLNGNDVLDNKARFFQENYECAFCSIETATFPGMLKHISKEHPWYDLTVHKNIR